jgi:hypothetical protein
MSPSRMKVNEFDVGAERGEIHRERRGGLLAAERLFQFPVTAVDPYAVARDVRRREEGEPHDVVPVHVRHEDMVGLRRRRAMPRERLLAERTHAGAQVAQHVVGSAGFDFDAGRVPAVASGNRQAQAVDEGCEVGVGGERLAGRGAQCRHDLVAYADGGQRDGQRTARAPEAYAHHAAAAS